MVERDAVNIVTGVRFSPPEPNTRRPEVGVLIGVCGVTADTPPLTERGIMILSTMLLAFLAVGNGQPSSIDMYPELPPDICCFGNENLLMFDEQNRPCPLDTIDYTLHICEHGCWAKVNDIGAQIPFQPFGDCVGCVWESYCSIVGIASCNGHNGDKMGYPPLLFLRSTSCYYPSTHDLCCYYCGDPLVTFTITCDYSQCD